MLVLIWNCGAFDVYEMPEASEAEIMSHGIAYVTKGRERISRVSKYPARLDYPGYLAYHADIGFIRLV